MPPLMLAGDTVGQKRWHFNKLVADAVASKHYELTPIGDTDSDIDNLLKIEIACKARNVDYVIEVMKSKDMLYAATAIKKSTWLITDPQYAHIINPEYLHTQLKPYMTTKAFNKLMLHVRLNLKDESRVEAFYEHFKDTESGCKWLQNCSIPFIENVIKNERRVPVGQFRRLCKRSARFLLYYTRAESRWGTTKEEVLFLLKSHTEEVMNMIEDQKHNHIPSLGKKKTKIIMKKFPQKVLDNFDMYHGSLDLSVFVKYLPKSEIKTFLCKATQYTFNNMDTWRYFLNNMEQEERFKFVKKTLIDKNDFKILFAKDKQSFLEGINTYQWYEFLPFDVAFSELKNLIRKQNVPAKRFSILIVLISCARKSPEHIKSLLKYCYEQHINEPYKYKIQFVNALLSSVSAHEFDVETWNYLNQLFHSMEVYIESNNDVRQCLEAIILYNVLHDKPVPEIVEQKQSFNTFRNIRNRLNDEQKNKLFTYLLNSAWSKIKTENIENESILEVTLNELKNVLMLLKDWNKTFNDYPFILEKIQELMKMKEENKWTTDMSCLYNVNKLWRKFMFEESLSLSLCEETCLNALKHKPQLLTRHDKQIHTLRTDDAVSLRRVLAKLRVYWPDSLARHWTEAYMQSFNEPTGQGAVIKGVFRLSPVNQVIELGKKHAPTSFKINWSESNQAEISLQKNIAKHLHVARPPVPLDTVLSYAKGDYLQYAVPSLNTILLNLSEIESREYLPKLLDAPVSLQKFGIRQAFLKFEINDLITIVSNIWNTTKNPSIRSIIFLCTYDKICKIKNQFKEKCLWKLLSLFLDDKTFEKGVGIYKKLIDVDTIPSSLQGEFFMKGYSILSSSPHSPDKESYLNQLLQCTTRVMDRLDEDFVADKLLSPAGTKLCSYDSQYINSFACYVLCGNSQENQLLRFNRVLRPAMEEAFQRWDDNNSGSLYVKSQFERLLEYLGWYFIVYFSLNKIPVPTKLFAEILKTLQKGLPEVKNYVLITSWKFVTEYIQLIGEHETVLNAFKLSNFTISDFVESTDYVYMGEEPEKNWRNNHKKLSPFLGPKIVLFLEKDCEKYGPTIYNLFGSALKNMFKMLTFTSDSYIVDTLKYMLVDENFIASYLLVSLCLPQHCSSSLKSEALELREKLKSNPSKIAKLHYSDLPSSKSLLAWQ